MGSQLRQAQDQQDQGIQALEELQRADSENLAKLLAEEMSQEDYDSQAEEIRDKIEATEGFVERATRLNTVSDRQVSIGDQVHKPNLRRPLADSGDSGDLDADDVAAARNRDRLSAAFDRFLDRNESVVDGVGPVLQKGSRERALLNKYLRPSREGQKGWQIRASLTKEDLDFLHRPRPERLMNAYVDRDGGFVTAEEMRNEMISLRAKQVGLAARVRPIQTTKATVSFPSAQVTFSFTKRGRTGQGSVTTLRLTDVFGKTKFMPAGRDIILKVPWELVEDATFDLLSFLAEEASRVSDEEDELLILHGSGSGEALGIITGLKKLYDEGATGVGIDPDGTDVPAFSGGAFNDKLIQVFDTYMLANARANAVWTGPRIFERKVRLFKTDAGGSNTGEYLFKRSLEAGAPNTLNGYPILISEFFTDTITSGNAGDPMFHFGDPRDYWWVTKQGLRLMVLDQLYAETREIGYMYDKAQDGALVRADGNIYARRQAA